MNEQSITDKYLETKLDTFIEQGWKEYPGGESSEHKFYIEMPSGSWTVMSVGKHKLVDVERPHFLYKGEIVMRGVQWKVVKHETA
jgi:hypothetical protein